MQLKAGTRLGHYEVVSSLGAGGMGEVYRAKDTKLGREVAIKLLLEEVSQDAERLARFSAACCFDGLPAPIGKGNNDRPLQAHRSPPKGYV